MTRPTIDSISARSILTAQKSGFLVSPPFPLTHTLSPYVGCGFGSTTCGKFCYAPALPSWRFQHPRSEWGRRVFAKANAANLLAETLSRVTSDRRQSMRIFFSPGTDPYQPHESSFGISRQCLEVFSRYDDLDLLVIQTRSPLVRRDFDLIRKIPYAWLSVSVETDDASRFRVDGGPTPDQRLRLLKDAVRTGIATQVAVSPCLPHSHLFSEVLVSVGADRIIVDTFVDGDGSHGKRTQVSPYGQENPDNSWRDSSHAKALFDDLVKKRATVSWSAAGFCGIPPRCIHHADT